MHGPHAGISREVFWNVQGDGFPVAQLVVYFCAVVAIVLFIRGLRRGGYMARRSIEKTGPGTDVPRSDNAGARLVYTLADVFFHRRLLREPYQGIFHLFIFWGFFALLITTAVVALQADFFYPIWSWWFMKDGFYLGLSLFADVFGALAIIGVLMAMGRRYFFRPDWLDKKPEDLLVLWFILFILVSGFTSEGLRISATELDSSSPMHDYVWFSPVGRTFAFLFAGMGKHALHTAHELCWWVHMFSAMSFIVFIAYSKLLHIFMTPANIFMRPVTDQPPIKTIPPGDFETAETFGVHEVEEYSDLFDVEACMRCGRCVEVCPAFATGKPLKPRDVIQDLRNCLETRAGSDKEYALIGDVIDKDTIWACTTCMACVEACPAYILQFPRLIDLRRYLVMMESDFPAEVMDVFRGMENNSNPWGIGAHLRADWAKDMGVPIMSEKGSAEYLFYVGDAGSFDDLNKSISRSLVKIFNSCGMDYAILGTEEGCDGDSAKKIGNEYLYQTLAMANIETFDKYGVKKIICMDPHAYNMMKKDYKELDGNYEVFHYLEILDELLGTGRLEPRQKLDLGTVTFHDSCYLGRYNGIYDQPRNILKAISKGAYVEMEYHHAKSFCCGAGGGRMWMEETLGSRINQQRTRQALNCGARTICTACPYCFTMLTDGIKELDLENSLQARDIAELVATACRLE